MKQTIPKSARLPRYSSLSFGISMALLFSPWYHPLNAAAYTVDSLADTNTGVGTSGTLRYCMTNATTAGDTIDCSTVGVAGGTITLTANLPTISNSISITGAAVTLDEGGTWDAFTITNAGTVVALQNMLITNPTANDSSTDANTTFNVTSSSQLRNLYTAGDTSLTASSLNGSINIPATGSLTLNANSTATAVTPILVAGTLTATSATISGDLTNTGTTSLTNTPVSGTATVTSGTFTATGAQSTIGTLTTGGTTTLSADAAVTGTLSVISGTTSLQSGADVQGASTVSNGAALTVDGAGSTLSTLDTFGTATLTNSAAITSSAVVESTGQLSATSSTIAGPLTVNGTATLTNTPVTNATAVGSTGTFTGTGASTVLSSLTSSGSTNLNTNASVSGNLSVLAGTTDLQTSATVLGASTVSSGAALTASGAGTTLNTLDTFGSTTLTAGANITGAAIVESSGTLNAASSFLSSTLVVNGTATLLNTPVSSNTTVGVTGTLNATGAGTTLNSLTSSGLSNLSTGASVTNALNVLAGTTSLQNGARVFGSSTVSSGATLTADGATTSLNTLDTFGTTVLTNSAFVTGTALVESTGLLNADSAFLLSTLGVDGTANLINTFVSDAVAVGSTGTFTGSGAGTILNDVLISAGNTTLTNGARVISSLAVLAGTTNLQSGANILGPTSVSSGAFLNVDGPTTTLATLDTSGTTTLTNNPSLTSVIVDPSGRLVGVSTVAGTINNFGLVSPGINGVGTLFSGNYVQQSNGTFESVVNGTTAGLSDSATTADIAGTLFVNILPHATYTMPGTYTIIQAAGGVNGTFAEIVFSTPALFQIFYLSNQVNIQVFPVFAMGLSGNAKQAADCLLSQPLIGPRSDLNTVFDALILLPATQFQTAFNQMQPSQYSAMNWVQLTNAFNLQRSIFRHGALWKKRENFGGFPTCLPAAPAPSESCSQECHIPCSPVSTCCGLKPDGWSGWMDLTGVWQQQKCADRQFGFRDRSGIFSIGFDGRYDTTTLGVFGAYQMDQLNWDRNAGSGVMRTGYGGLYAMYINENFLVDISGLVGYTTYSTKRRIQFSSIRRTAAASFHSYEGVAGIGLGSYNTLCGVEWVPYGRVDYAYLTQKAFNERQAESLNLRVNTYNTSLVQAEFGVFFEKTCNLLSGLITPKLNLSYIGQFAVLHKHINARFTSIPSCIFPVRGWNYGRNLFAPTLAITYFSPCYQIAFELGYAAQVGRRYWNQQACASLDWKF